MTLRPVCRNIVINWSPIWSLIISPRVLFMERTMQSTSPLIKWWKDSRPIYACEDVLKVDKNTDKDRAKSKRAENHAKEGEKKCEFIDSIQTTIENAKRGCLILAIYSILEIIFNHPSKIFNKIILTVLAQMNKFRQTSGPQYFGSAKKSRPYLIKKASSRPTIPIQDQDLIVPSNNLNWLLQNGR